MNGEIHVKVGGDHGGKSFKACYQVCNTKAPNSKDNTVVYSIFEAKDYRPNIRTGLSMFTSQIDTLQKCQWRYIIKIHHITFIIYTANTDIYNVTTKSNFYLGVNQSECLSLVTTNFYAWHMELLVQMASSIEIVK